MSNNNYYSEGKYRCNHPESDFEKTSTNPIEMKKENFVEYTHRNETANYRYDVWNGSDSVSTSNYGNTSYLKTPSGYNNNTYTNDRYNRSYSTNSNRNKKSSPKGVIIFIILIYFLPVLFSIIGTIFSAIADLL